MWHIWGQWSWGLWHGLTYSELECAGDELQSITPLSSVPVRQPDKVVLSWEDLEPEFSRKYLRLGFILGGAFILFEVVQEECWVSLALQMQDLNLSFQWLSELSCFNSSFSGECVDVDYNKYCNLYYSTGHQESEETLALWQMPLWWYPPSRPLPTILQHSRRMQRSRNLLKRWSLKSLWWSLACGISLGTALSSTPVTTMRRNPDAALQRMSVPGPCQKVVIFLSFALGWWLISKCCFSYGSQLQYRNIV